MRAYKFTRPGAVGLLTGFAWPTPARGSPGSWVEAEAAEPCRAGIHACRPAHFPFWVAEELWVIELVEAWTAGGATAFGKDCALRARDLATDALVAAGWLGPAEQLGSCSSLDTLPGVAASMARQTTGQAALMARYAAD